MAKIMIPSFPYNKKTPPLQLIAACTALLERTNLDDTLTTREQDFLRSGNFGQRKRVLVKMYMADLARATQAALDSGIVSHLPQDIQETLAYGVPVNGRMSYLERRELLDALWAVKRLVKATEQPSHTQPGSRRGGGRSPQKAAKSARDKEIRAGMRSPKGAKPQMGQGRAA